MPAAKPFAVLQRVAHSGLCWVIIALGCSRSAEQPRSSNDVAAGAGVGNAQGFPDGPEVPPQIQQELERIGASQAEGLDGATVQVHRAYISSADSVRIQEQHRHDFQVVVVDVTFDDFGDSFDLDDVDAIDGESNDNYGSDPLLYGVRADGEVCDIDDPDLRRRPQSLRVLLGYSVPKTCRSLRLGYWGKVIAPAATVLEPDGPALPKDKG